MDLESLWGCFQHLLPCVMTETGNFHNWNQWFFLHIREYASMSCFPIPCEGNCRQHLISFTPLRNIFGFDQLEQTVALSCICTAQSPGQRWAKIRSQVAELDQGQDLSFTSFGPWRICNTWEMASMGFARWELPHLLSQYNSLSPGVCGYYLSAKASKNTEILSWLVNKWNRHLEHNRARK